MGLPQRPYITLGTLRQQLIYPHATEKWSDMLSGGEQQRLGFARLFYHKPMFCIMDESTSALDVELETKCMSMCAMYEITAVSVGHRPTLIPFHTHVMKLDGNGSCTMERVSP